MLNLVALSLLFIYYWYFYTDSSKPVPKPATGAPLKAEDSSPQFDMQFKHQFTVRVNGQAKWHHMLPRDRYALSNQRVIPKDVCYGIASGRRVEASGQPLYHYLKNRSDSSLDALSFRRDTPYTVQVGKVYYFTCQNNRIERLGICPSGTIFRNGNCIDINMCTGKPDGTKFAGNSITTYFTCKHGRESKVQSCPPDQFFYHDRCVRMEDLVHRCRFYSNVPLLLDERTRIDCRHGKPVRTQCAPGYRFFDREYCESDRCVGQPDYARLPLPEREVEPFRFSPGYWECLGGKVSRTVECPQIWDDSLSRGENLTFLPMVFSGTECSVPEFGVNVFSNDPDVMVPTYEFSRHLQNWQWADLYDRAAGYDQSRKRRVLPPDMRVSKRFKAENACSAGLLLPVHEQPRQYYDCDRRAVFDCPNFEFFNGVQCVPEPPHAFKFKGLPIFNFDSLNFESWIVPTDYSNARPLQCDNSEPELVAPYNICSDPDCVPYAFLSMIPDLALFLPSDQRAKCRFDEASRRLVKEHVHFPYSFWTQKLMAGSDACTPGQNLRTGNFIWDSSVFATCDPNRPFIFCPSPHSGGIELFGQNTYACSPPATNRALLNTVDWTPFAVNELRRVLPDTWTGNPQYVKLNRGDRKFRDLPQDGLEIPLKTKTNLQSRQPIQVEFRLRTTYPPNVAFEYDEQGILTPRIGHDGQGFLVKLNDFTSKPLRFPRYRFKNHVDSMQGTHLV